MKIRLLVLLAALLLAGEAYGQDPATVARTGDPTTAKTTRASEVPYRQPADMQTGVPGQPVKLDPAAGTYLWNIDEAGRFLVAPANQEDRDRLLKHGDLTPGPGGQTRGVARIAGELRWDAARARWVMNADSSYNFQRTDGPANLHVKNLEAAREVLAQTGTDVSKVELDFMALRDGTPWTLVRITWEGVFARFRTWLQGRTVASSERSESRGFERTTTTPGFTRILERTAEVRVRDRARVR